MNDKIQIQIMPGQKTTVVAFPGQLRCSSCGYNLYCTENFQDMQLMKCVTSGCDMHERLLKVKVPTLEAEIVA